MVTTREELAAAEANVVALREAARLAEQHAAALRRDGVIDEPEEDGAVVRFALRMKIGRGQSFVYEYAARRVNGKWFTTGSTCPRDGYRWESLWRWINDHELVGPFELATFESDGDSDMVQRRGF